MTSLAIPSLPPARRLRLLLLALGGVGLLLLASVALRAQVAGNRGITPVASSPDIAVDGIKVDVTADTPAAARQKGWKQAIELAWKKANGPAIPEDQLDDMVSSITIGHEQIGEHRYIATLGVVFDRQRAGPLLGAGGAKVRSAPMLTLPVLVAGGTATMFETRNPWQRAWAEHQFGSSAVDYVRPSGAGGESLLLTYGQTTRRSRAWWNTILGQFNASDVLIPIAELHYLWPGGPVEGHFIARHGPDSRVIGEFDLRAETPDQVPAMLDMAVARFDEIFTRAMNKGILKPDPTLSLDNVRMAPWASALLQQSRAADQAAVENSMNLPLAPPSAQAGAPVPAPVAMTTFTVQAATPTPGSFDSTLTSLRSLGDVRAVSVSSTAIGGTSVLQVTYSGSLSQLAAELRNRGWHVNEGKNVLAIGH